jgi:hypothetical protein
MWEIRGTKQYYDRHKKVGGRALRIYLGRGERAEQAAAEDERHRSEVEAARTERKRLEEVDAQISRVAARMESLARATLMLGGYYRHQRAEWRRWRGP